MSSTSALDSISSPPVNSNTAVTPRQQVHLYPALASDFVIHYRDTDFHVHTFVLHHHSGYFRNHLSATAPAGKVEKEKVVGKGNKRRKVVTFSTTETSEVCQHHMAYIRCLHLPTKFGDTPASNEDFHFFLRHLYFASTLHLPPFIPNKVILDSLDSLTDESPTCLEFPPTASVQKDSVMARSLEVYTGKATEQLEWGEALLSLFHFFDCQQAMRRTQEVIIRGDMSTCDQAWYWLPGAVRHRMKEVEDACIKKLGRDNEMGRRVDNEELHSILDELPSRIIARIMAAMRS